MPRLRHLALLVCLAVPLSSCGKKGDPSPPIRMVPAAATDLSVVRRGDELLVELPYPQTTAAGTPLPRISEVAVWELVGAVPAGVTEIPEVDESHFLAAATPGRMVTEDELPAVVQGNRIVLSVPVPELRPEDPKEPPRTGRAVLTVAAKTVGPGGEESAFSNRVTFELVEPPAPPAGLQAEGRAGGVEVRWSYDAPEAVAEDEDEDETAETAEEDPGFAGFHVYRRRATERRYGPPLRGVGRRARSFVDESALFGERYIYTVTAVASRRPAVVESRLAEEVEVDYRDRFPPPVPEGLVALVVEDRVRLVWEGSDAPDLAGYRVYRRSPDTQELEPVTEEPIRTTEYQDRDVLAGATYTYRVTAVDESGNESEPSEPAVAVIR